ncbi:MAG: metallophosphoesterase [Solirubrobacteraceae bacterium]
MANDRWRAVAFTAASHGPLSAQRQVLRRRPIEPGPKFEPLPTPVGLPPYRRALADVLGPDQMQAIERAGALRFHCVGDTGGWRDPRPQRRVAKVMVEELAEPEPAHFFYHLGDIVYPHGEDAHYSAQFLSPYADYDAPIFAVPGNHDGEVVGDSRAGPLEPFVRTFCSSAAPLHDAAIRVPRPSSVQPHVFWTLVHDWVWVVGLYTNVDEDGEIEADQLEWLTGELAAAPSDVTLIVALHRPVYSADIVHGSNLALGDALDACFHRADRLPDAVFGAHAHNYQRFGRRVDGRTIPYVVAGAGGFHERHRIGAGVTELPASFPGLPSLTLEAYEWAEHGFMTVTVGRRGGQVVYRTVSDAGARTFDTFAIVPGRLG